MSSSKVGKRGAWLRRAVVVGGLFTALGVGISYAARARAAGIPEADVLTYTGYLESEPGIPLEGEIAVAVSFWASAEAEKPACTVKEPQMVLSGGRFQLALSADCVAAVRTSPGVLVEVEVDGISLGRTKLGAVPYAVEASHATSADTASGELAERLATFQVKDKPSAFRAFRNVDQTIAGAKVVTLDLNGEDLDLGDELDLDSNVFSPQTTGYYNLECSIFYNAPGVTTIWHALIFLNGVEVAGTVVNIDGYAATPRATYFGKLKSGDKLTCAAAHYGPAPQTIWGYKSRSYFSGYRVSGL